MFKQKILIVILILALSVSLFGCKKNEKSGENNSQNQETSSTITGAVIVSLNPVAATVKEGDLAKIAINLNALNTKINTSQIVVNYNPDILEYDSTSTVSSKFTMWIKKDGGEGQVTLVSAEPNPGVTGSDAYVGTVVFKAKKKGVSEITFNKELSKMITSDEVDMLRSEGHLNTTITVD